MAIPRARLVALQSLLDANDVELVPTLRTLLADKAVLREAAIRGFAQYDSPEVADSLLDSYAEFTPQQRRLALGTLCSRATSGNRLLAAIESKAVPGTDLTADLGPAASFSKGQVH